MSKKQMKKDKKKLIKLKQKEITSRNKELKKEAQNKIELMDLNESAIPDIEDKIERNGPRGYVLKILKDMVDDMNTEGVEDKEIISVAQFFIKFAETPREVYNELLKLGNINLSNNKKKLMNKSNVNLNLTERVLLKNRMQGIIMEYQFKDLSTTNIDYSGIRVFFETVYRLILVGLENRKIKRIDTYLGYGDVISDLIVEYSDDNSKYNINDNTYINVTWKPLDNLYNTYAIYKNKYKNFSKGSLQSLATAADMYKEYASRNNGKEIISYSGIVLNYACSFESELKSLISKKFDLNKKKLKLVDAINYLEKINNPFLSNKKTIDALHKVRVLRNRVAHGEPTTHEEYRYVYDLLLSTGILEYINEELANIHKNTEIQAFTCGEDVCFKNKGVKQGYEEVIKSLAIAANKGDSKAQVTLGSIYYEGIIIKQDFEEAVKWYTKAAMQGQAEAQTLLAGMYLFSLGVNQDYGKAIKWYTKAAEQGQAEAQSYLGDMHYDGVGVQQDYEKAAKWYAKAVNQYYDEAQFKLGKMYCSGDGVKQDIKKGIELLINAANQGNKEAQFHLGYIYYNSDIVKHDFEEAAKWYAKAAAQGHIKSQLYLGILYHNGDGVKQDFKESTRLLKKAAAQGDEEAQYLLDEIKKQNLHNY